MTKRSGRRATEHNQTDLFDATSHATSPKKARRPGRTALPFAKTPSPLGSPTAEKTTVTPTGALLNVRQAAARLGLSKSTLDKMRGAGTGPRFIKSTARAVRYDPADLDAWVEARRRTSTSEAGQ